MGGGAVVDDGVGARDAHLARVMELALRLSAATRAEDGSAEWTASEAKVFCYLGLVAAPEGETTVEIQKGAGLAQSKVSEAMTGLRARKIVDVVLVRRAGLKSIQRLVLARPFEEVLDEALAPVLAQRARFDAEMAWLRERAALRSVEKVQGGAVASVAATVEASGSGAE